MICQKCAAQVPDESVFCLRCGAKLSVSQHRKPKTRANGTGTAYKRGSTWTSRAIVGWHPSKDGSHRVPEWRTKTGFATKKEALNYCAKLLEQKTKLQMAPDLKHYWKLYEEKKLPSLSDSKQTAYRIAWGKLKLLHLRKVDSLTVKDLCDSVSGLNYYPARDIKVLLNHLFELAGADGWVKKDLPSYIDLPKLEETEREPFSTDEQKRLWKSYEDGNEFAAVPLIMIYTGMMPGELMKMTVDMVDLENKRIVGAGLKTNVRKASAVYLPDAILPVIQSVIEGKDDKIWKVNKDRFYNLYYEALEKANVRKLQPYSCRHTTATALAIDNNIAPQTVKKIMRWSTTKMLDRYAHPDENDVYDAVNTLQNPDQNPDQKLT